jgi:hypothetical protein
MKRGMMLNYIGIDIGGTKCAVMTAEYENGNIKLLKKEKFTYICVILMILKSNKYEKRVERCA